MSRPSLRRGARWAARWILPVLVLFALYAVFDGWRALGTRASGARRARIENSPQWKDGQFHNPEPLVNDWWGGLAGMFAMSPHASPVGSLPAVRLDPKELATPPASGLRVTWLGHSTMLIEIDGYRVLTDPMWSERSSPLSWIGPKRWLSPPIALEALPAIDAVVISHDHYDHLDHPTVAAMKDWNTTFVVPLGVGANLAYWGIPESRIAEVDWWERVRVGALEIVCTPARHASGRGLFDKDTSLWAGYAFVGATHRAYYSGDTGLFPAMREIGEQLGPFDVTMIEVGQYHRTWPDWHIGPEQAVDAHRILRGRVMLPVHWAALTLAFHGWTEPVERVLAAAERADVKVLTPKPGQSVEPTTGPSLERWWPSLPWEGESQNPVVSTQVSRAGLLTP